MFKFEFEERDNSILNEAAWWNAGDFIVDLVAELATKLLTEGHGIPPVALKWAGVDAHPQDASPEEWGRAGRSWRTRLQGLVKACHAWRRADEKGDFEARERAAKEVGEKLGGLLPYMWD